MTERSMPREIVKFWPVRRSDITLFVFAQCADGSLWYLLVGDNIWHRLPAIPQDITEPATGAIDPSHPLGATT